MAATWRATQKASRRAELLRAAAQLFATRGFAAVSTTELGDAVGMSGPALYNYFPSKEALLEAILIEASERLLSGCRAIISESPDTTECVTRLIDFHLDFAISDPGTIDIQDRELPHLSGDANQRVRRLQREYVQAWDEVLKFKLPHLSGEERQTRLLGVFGLLNSTPYSARESGTQASRILARMAHRALLG